MNEKVILPWLILLTILTLLSFTVSNTDTVTEKILNDDFIVYVEDYVATNNDLLRHQDEFNKNVLDYMIANNNLWQNTVNNNLLTIDGMTEFITTR